MNPVNLRCVTTRDPTLRIGDAVYLDAAYQAARAELPHHTPLLIVVSEIRFGVFLILRDYCTTFAVNPSLAQQPAGRNFRRNDLRVCAITGFQKMPTAWIRGSVTAHNNFHHMGWYYQFKCGEEDSRLHKRNGQTNGPVTCLMCLAT